MKCQFCDNPATLRLPHPTKKKQAVHVCDRCARAHNLVPAAPTCQLCDSPATVHVTDIVNKKKREVHLCDRCAREHDVIADPPGPQIGVKALLGLLMGPFQQAQPAEGVALTCPACGLQYAQFRADGRLGCPAEYDAFREVLEPLLERIHRSVVHAGKVPRSQRRQRREAEVRDLRLKMQAAAKAENYEEAARLRDLIRQKEASE